MTWRRVPESEAAESWDAQLVEFAGHNLYQSSEWGRYKSIRGWRPEYFQAEADGTRVAMLMALVREYPLRTVVSWWPGGLAGTLDGCSPDAMRQLASLLGARALYCRSSFVRRRNAEDAVRLDAQGWTRPAHPVSAGMSAIWDLRPPAAELLAGLNKNWRYSLKQAQKSGLVVERLVDPSIPELAALCTAMHASKGVDGAFPESEVAAMLTAMGHRAVVFACRNAAGELMAFHSCAILGAQAWELIAATSPEGRRAGASFAVLWTLVLHCQREGVERYDLAGLDPVNAPGVASFKRWTGAQDVEWLGEWEWSTSALLRHGVNLAARARTASGLP